jgi:hypothetical protein
VKCSRVKAGNISATVCGRHRIEVCVKCGAPADKLCDWKLPGVFESPRVRGEYPKQATCDKPVCSACAVSPAHGKGVCAICGEGPCADEETPARAAYGETWNDRIGAERKP